MIKGPLITRYHFTIKHMQHHKKIVQCLIKIIDLVIFHKYLMPATLRDAIIVISKSFMLQVA